MTKAQRFEGGGNYLNAKFVEENAIDAVTIRGDIELVEFTRDGKSVEKYQASDVRYDGRGRDDPDVWTMNHKSSNVLFDVLGDDTDDWTGIEIPLTLEGDGEYRHISVDKLRLKKSRKR